MRRYRAATISILAMFVAIPLAACTPATPTPPPTPPPPTDVPTIAPTETPVPSATPSMPSTATVTPTVRVARVVRTAAPVASGPTLVADAPQVAAGACTVLRWSVAAGQAVTLQGAPVPAQGSQEVCPTTDTTYVLSWVNKDGTVGGASVTVRSEGASQVAAKDDDEDDEDDKPTRPAQPAAPATETQCVGPECEEKPPVFVTVAPTTGPAEPTTEPPTPSP